MEGETVLVTGAGGELGHQLLPALLRRGARVVALDVRGLPPERPAGLAETVRGDLLDEHLLDRIFEVHAPQRIFHLAAVLSREAEEHPLRAHRVNVDGTLALLRRAGEAAARLGRPVQFLFPSSIAVYGLPDAAAKARAGRVREDQWTQPRGIYGCNKLYCELLGVYCTQRRQRGGQSGVDFRALRFPGLISAETTPTGGTTDYAPEMLHAAARGEAYRVFVAPETRLPFMAMTDAVEAFLRLAEAPESRLGRRVYNVGAFSPTAAEIADLVRQAFPGAQIAFAPDPARQRLVDSWPADVDDTAAREDWGFAPRLGLREAFLDYLLPALRERYGAGR